MNERQNPIVDFAAKAKPPPAGENEVQVHSGNGDDPNVTVFGNKTKTVDPLVAGGRNAPMDPAEHIEITFNVDEFDWPEQEGEIAELPPSHSVQVHCGDGSDHSVDKAFRRWRQQVLNDPHNQATPEEMGACKHCQGDGYEPIDVDRPHRQPETCDHCGGTGMEPT